MQAFEQVVVKPFVRPRRSVVRQRQGDDARHFGAFCLATGIETIEGQPYNPQSQSRVERAHRTLKNGVAAAQMQGSKASLVTLVLRVAHEMNVAPSEYSDGLSPHRDRKSTRLNSSHRT